VQDRDFPGNLGEKYFEQPKPLNVDAFFRALQLFFNPATMGYPAWFN